MATRIHRLLLCAIAVSSSAAAAQAQTDPAAELDTLSRASADVEPGLALARKQVGGGDFLGAMATLERLMITHPQAKAPRLLHASLLCRLDDPGGAVLEFDELRGHQFSDRDWADATAPCDANASGSGG